MSETALHANPSLWIINRRCDIAFIFGGAAASLSVPLIVMWRAELLPILFWIWIFFFDGTHSWATYSRTYIDKRYWQTDRPLLLRSLLCFAAPIFAVALRLIFGSMDPINLFLLVVQGWSYYHIVRQHYGYVSIYDRKSKADYRSHLVNKWVLYVGLWTPYIYFLFIHPVNRKIAKLAAGNLPMLMPADNSLIDAAVSIAAAFLSIGAFLYLIVHNLRRRERGESFGPATFFTAACLLVYSLIFYLFARMEPMLHGAATPIQSFMLIQIMITLFHNIQYHAIVWHYNKKRYLQNGESRSAYGLAATLNRNFPIYILAGLLFSFGYIAAAWHTTEYPSLQGRVPETIFAPIAFCIWWGLAMHHYYLDQRIWRVSRSKDLQEKLGIAY